MIIDIHTHVHTPEDAAKPYWRGRCPMTIETVGPEHFLLGTDAPPLKSLKSQGVALIKELRLSQADEQKVYCDNARRLLKI